MIHPRPMYRTLIPLIACIATTALLSAPPNKALRGKKGELILPKANLLKIAGKPFINALADYYWLQTSYALGMANSQKSLLTVYHYGDLVVQLDPDFCYAYQFVGQAIPLNVGGSRRYANVSESTEIMERGLKNPRCTLNPNMRLLLSFNYSHFYNRYKDAADTLAPLINLPETVEFIPKLATRLYSQSGNTDTALKIAQALYETSPYEDEREAYAERINEILLEKALQAIEAAQEAFLKKENRYPEGVDELVKAGFLEAVPEDPFGGTIYLSSDDHQAHSTERDKRLVVSEVVYD